MELKKHGGIEYFDAGCEGFTGAFLTRLGGVSEKPYESLNMSHTVGDDEKSVGENYARVFSAFNIDSRRFIWMRQVHSDTVLVLRKGTIYPFNLDSFRCDAVVTDDESLVLSLLTADCVPILLTDKNRGAFGVVHAGWRGTAKSIAKKAVSVMVREFFCDVKEISAYIGPAIGVCCYEVGDEVANGLGASLEKGGSGAKVFSGGRVYADLKGYNAAQLIESGISAHNITLSDLCTSCTSEMFFSHRRERLTGRQISLIFKASVDALQAPQVTS